MTLGSNVFPNATTRLQVNGIAVWITMALLALLGGAVVHAGPAILSATTISGTMLLGLTPVFLLWRWRRAGPASCFGSVLLGLLLGSGLALGEVPGRIGDGAYGNLLVVNVIGVCLCFGVYVLLAWLVPAGPTDRTAAAGERSVREPVAPAAFGAPTMA